MTTHNIIFSNNPKKTTPGLIIRAIKIAGLSNAGVEEKINWELIFKHGDHTRYEGTITPATDLQNLLNDYRQHSQPRPQEAAKKKAKREEYKVIEEYQVIFHDVPKQDVRNKLRECHKLGKAIEKDIRVTFMDGRALTADFNIHNGAKVETLNYLYLEYLAGGEVPFRHAIDDCKSQLADLTGTGEASKRTGPKRRAESFKRSLGDFKVKSTETEIRIGFASVTLGMKQLLEEAALSLNLTSRTNLSGKQFTIDHENRELCLPKKPTSVWTIALKELIQEQKAASPSRAA